MQWGSLDHLRHVFAAILIGFCATLSYVAGEQTVIKRTLQNFTPINVTSPRYPNNYPNNADTAWQISAPTGFRIMAKPGFLELERNKDFLRIGDGHGKELIRLTGQGAPPSVLSPANIMWMNFTSDGSSMAKGFQVEVTIFNQTDVRLVGGTTPFNGRVEVRFGTSSWGTVSSDEWNLKDAVTVCKEMGLPGASSAVTGAYYGAGTGTVWATQVDCNNEHFRLKDCPLLSPCNGCPHSQDAGANCHRPNYLGCFFLPNLGSSVNAKSVENCITRCDQMNRRFAALNGDRCVCKDSISFPESAEDDTMCNRKCSENSNEACGGVSDSSIYSVYDTQFATCPDPGQLGNATRTGNSFQLGSKVKYNCSDGFYMVGNWEMTCLAGDSFQHPKWNSKLPTCIGQIRYGTVPTNTTITAQPQTEKINSTTIIIIVIVIIAIVILTILVVCICRCRKNGRCQRKEPKDEMWY